MIAKKYKQEKQKGVIIMEILYKPIRPAQTKYMKIILRILVTAIGVMLAANLVPGIMVSGFWTAVVVAIVLGILNVTVGFILKVLTFPLSVVTFGFFFLVINALMFWAASLVKGFYVSGFWAAFFGSLVVTIISMAGRALVRSDAQNRWN